MNREERLKAITGKDPGFRVPDGYFDDIYAKISDSLPERKELKAAPMSKWHRIRPYVYLAAMFAGIWCMMKMFHMMSTASEVSLDNPPTIVADALTNTANDDVIIPVYTITEEDLTSDLSAEYDEDFNSFVEDFDYTLEPEYAEIDIPELEEALDFQADDDKQLVTAQNLEPEGAI